MTSSIPILRLGDALLVSIQVDLQDDDVVALQEELAERIVATSARGVIIDISGVGEKAEAVINFAGVGTKHLALAWAPLKKR